MLENYTNYITYVRCLSPYTVYKNKKGLRIFGQFLGKDLNNPESILYSDVYSFIQDLTKKGLKASSCNAYLDGVKSYLRYCRDIKGLNVIDIDKVKGLKIRERNVGFFNKEEKNQILNCVNTGLGKREITQLRNKLLVYMLLSTGLRCHELAKIKVSEIGECLQVIGKGGKRRVSYLKPELLNMIYEYLSKREKKSEYLFDGKKDKHIYEGSIRVIFAKMTSLLGFKIHAHKFRHTFCTDLLHIPGANIYNVSKLMGHSNIATTQIYLGCDNQELKNLQFGLNF